MRLFTLVLLAISAESLLTFSTPAENENGNEKNKMKIEDHRTEKFLPKISNKDDDDLIGVRHTFTFQGRSVTIDEISTRDSELLYFGPTRDPYIFSDNSLFGVEFNHRTKISIFPSMHYQTSPESPPYNKERVSSWEEFMKYIQNGKRFYEADSFPTPSPYDVALPMELAEFPPGQELSLPELELLSVTGTSSSVEVIIRIDWMKLSLDLSIVDGSPFELKSALKNERNFDLDEAQKAEEKWKRMTPEQRQEHYDERVTKGLAELYAKEEREAQLNEAHRREEQFIESILESASNVRQNDR